jgi:hypothetical protein
MNNVVPILRPRLRAAHGVYFIDPTRPDSGIIPLGVFCEIITARGHGLALKARSALAKVELAVIAPVFRDRLSNPFSYFSEEFDEAWDKAAPGQAIEFLAARHSAALSVLAPRSTSAIWDFFHGDQAKLASAAKREYATLLDKPPIMSPPVERIQIAALAA